MRLPLALAAAAGCYDPPDFPIEESLEIIPSNACAIERSDTVACALDGDTVDLGACGEDAGERVRMLGVDAPEIEHPPDPADCYGDEAFAALRSLLVGQRVVVSFDEACADAFGRTLAYVWLVDEALDRVAGDPDFDHYVRTLPGEEDPALLVNEWVISRGWAEVFPEELFGRLLYQDALEEAEADAVVSGRGLWGACAAR